ncbi:hypothetical protein BH11BAC7_BH11BAC7_26270 [soil metagenome]
MKKLIFLIILIIPLTNYAQLVDGNYIYNDSKGVACNINVSQSGFAISVVLKDGNNTYKGTGTFRNEHGQGWYEFQTPECNFEFDVPNDSIIISKFDCKSDEGGKKYVLVKTELSCAEWIGTYKNSSDGVLIITCDADGTGLKYKLTIGGQSDCSGVNWEGSAKMSSENQATDNKDCPVTIELNGNKIIFSIDFTCDSMVGMKCLSVFDGEFSK